MEKIRIEKQQSMGSSRLTDRLKQSQKMPDEEPESMNKEDLKMVDKL